MHKESPGKNSYDAWINELEDVELMIKIRRRIEMEKLVSSISTRFLQQDMQSFDQLILKSLSKIGVFCQVDRCYLYLVQENGMLKNTHEWVADGIPSILPARRQESVSNLKWFHNKLYKYSVVHVPDVADLPSIAAQLKKTLEKNGIQSTLAVPMHYKDELIGYLGFDSIRKKVYWSQEDINLLNVIGEVLVNAFLRQRRERDLVELNDQLKHLNQTLEVRVEQRTTELLGQNEKIREYAHFNAHVFRAPLARILGLINLLKTRKLNEADRKYAFRKLEESALDLEVSVAEMAKTLNE